MIRIATDRDGSTRAQLFPVIARELLSHAQAEDAELYTVLADHESTRSLVMDLEAGHERIEMLLAELASMPTAGSAWLIRFRELQSAVQEHVDMEENQVFPIARHIISPELAEEIDHRYRIEKTRGPLPPPTIDIPPPEPPPAHPAL
jgi:hemerythrin-like domain-containing protein